MNCCRFGHRENILRIRGHMLELYIPRNRYDNKNQNIREGNDLSSTLSSSENKSVSSTSIHTNGFFPLKETPSVQKPYSIPSGTSINGTENPKAMQKNKNSADNMQVMNKSKISKGIVR